MPIPYQKSPIDYNNLCVDFSVFLPLQVHEDRDWVGLVGT